MSRRLFQNKIFVKKSNIHGYGVFADKNIKKNERIEECYFILSNCEDDVIIDYVFDLKGRSALLLGYGSLYNHSEDPNTDYTLNKKRKIATFKAIRPIKKGEEILISYGEEWFSSRNKREKKSSKIKKRKHRRR